MHTPAAGNLKRRTVAAILLAGCALLFVAGCATAPRTTTTLAPAFAPTTIAPAPPPAATIGVASYYGWPYHGRRTASGEIYDMRKMTAAHQTLPFGVSVRVTDLSNNRSVVVRINDRGPFKRGRIIDLSVAAAQQLGIIQKGSATVRVEVLAEGEGAARSDVELTYGDPSALHP